MLLFDLEHQRQCLWQSWNSFAILAGAIILHEPIYSYHVIGATLIIAGILGMNLMRKK